MLTTKYTYTLPFRYPLQAENRMNLKSISTNYEPDKSHCGTEPHDFRFLSLNLTENKSKKQIKGHIFLN